MSPQFLEGIDWRRPWLAPLLPAALPLLGVADWRQAINEASCHANLRNHRQLPIQFVAQSDLPKEIAYEAHISATGKVPTRDNLHDFFNALTWLTFPAIKSRLNALQSLEIERAAVSSVATSSPGRGKVRDAATIFDESSALLIATNPELIDDLRCHRWREAFIGRRQSFEFDCSVWLFGHALQEKLAAPYKAITAHAWVVPAAADFFAMQPSEQRRWVDMKVALQLADGLVTTQFTPLPVLGIPGWCADQDAEFYNDVGVFRPIRKPVV